MKIDPVLLKRLRESRRLSRKELAAKSHVSAKQIQRLENPDEASEAPRQVTLNRLAGALRVTPGVLTGEETVPPSDPLLTPPSARVTQRLSTEALLALDLVESRYGVPANAILNAAPLFFALLAESSLAWRKKELAELRKAIDRVLDMGGGSNRKRFALGAVRAIEDSDYEEEAINGRDLCNDPYPGDYSFPLSGEGGISPFAEYLRKLSEKLGVPGMEVDEGGFVSPGMHDGIPGYSVCKDELEQIVPTGSRAFYALSNGDVRISEIPEELRPDGAAGKRHKWLEGRMSRKTIRDLENLVKFWMDLGFDDPWKSPTNEADQP